MCLHEEKAACWDVLVKEHGVWRAGDLPSSLVERSPSKQEALSSVANTKEAKFLFRDGEVVSLFPVKALA